MGTRLPLLLSSLLVRSKCLKARHVTSKVPQLNVAVDGQDREIALISCEFLK